MAYLGPPPARTPVTSAQITDASVTAAKLATNAVTTVKIADDGVTTDKIGGLTTLATNILTETTAASGVTIDGVLIKDALVTGDINFGQDTLNHFDYGTFTPSASIAGSTPATVVSAGGAYIRIGKVVYFHFSVNINRDSGETGALIYTGLPFTGTSSGQNWASVQAWFNDNAFGFNTSQGFVQPLVRPQTGDVYIYGAPTSITTALVGLDAAYVLRAANNAQISFGGFYQI